VGDIEVAADDDGFFLGEFAEESAQGGVPFFLPVRQAQKFALGIRDINVDEPAAGEFGGQHAAFFGVFMRFGEIAQHTERFDLRQNGGAGVTRLGGVVPELVGKRQRQFGNMFRRGFYFLQAQNIRRALFDDGQKALAEGRAHAVDIPGNKSRH